MPIQGKPRARKAESSKLATGTEGGLPLGKQLAHTEKHIRDAAVSNLTAFLSSGGAVHSELTSDTPPIAPSSVSASSASSSSATRIQRRGTKKLLPDLEMKRLWKGLFFCFWMSDKPLVQQRLASDLSKIILDLDPSSEGEKKKEESEDYDRLDVALDFVAGFWEALSREWSGIDRLRIDKYYMLIRRWTSATFQLLRRHSWSAYAVGRFNEILLDPEFGPFSTGNSRIPLSLGWHLADIWMDELEKVAVASSEQEREEVIPVVETLLPFMVGAAKSSNPLTLTRFTEAVFQPMVDACSVPENDDAERPTKRRKVADEDIAESSDEEEEEEIAYSTLASTGSVGFGATKPASKESLRQELVRRLFQEASKPTEQGVRDANRRKIYAFVKASGGFEEDEDEDEE